MKTTAHIKKFFGELDIYFDNTDNKIMFISRPNVDLYDIIIEIEGNKLTFNNLKKISDFFDTTSINIEPQHQSGGCSTCGYGNRTYIEIEIKGVIVYEED